MRWFFSRKHIEKVKHTWGAGTIWGGKDLRHWLQHPAVQARINFKVSGRPNVNRFEYFLNEYLAGKMPVGRALTLGCGVGELERGLCHYNFAQRHEGVDISDEAIRRAVESAAGLPQIEYRCENLDALVLTPDSYDVIFGVSSIHHVQALEHLFSQVQRALKTGAYFFLDEYIGPTRFQWTDEQLRVMNEQLRLLPKNLRRSVTGHREFKHAIERKSLEEILLADPSEAIRSAEIVPLLSRFFKVIEIKGYGGSVIHELLYDIAGNFSEENPGSLDHLQTLFRVEDEMIAGGRLQHDFAVIIAQR